MGKASCDRCGGRMSKETEEFPLQELKVLKRGKDVHVGTPLGSGGYYFGPSIIDFGFEVDGDLEEAEKLKQKLLKFLGSGYCVERNGRIVMVRKIFKE